MTSNKFETSIVNLEQLQQFKFIVPTYQRPYVWTEEPIIKLLGDLFKSFELDPKQDVFIGTIITREEKNSAELIDGQQRFTTLWLTALVFAEKNINSHLERFLRENGGALKLNFEIRTEVEKYFNMLLSKETDEESKLIENHIISKFPYLENIVKALTIIRSQLKNIEENTLRDFGNYIYKKVNFIKNTAPFKIDLNKLFSTINSAGVQLEQTDIIKANLLKRLDKKVMFSKIWEACENMDNFFERNIRDSFPEEKWINVDVSRFVPFSEDIFFTNTDEKEISEGNIAFTISELRQEEFSEYNEENKEELSEKDRLPQGVYCRSIINFGQLLLHTYRLHLKQEKRDDFEGTFHINRLIDIFKTLENRDLTEIKRFFFLLWKVRFLFDKYIVKWITDADTKTENLELMNVTKNPNDKYYGRSMSEKSAMLMLQSVMYFTGDYLRQYWLTSYLGYLLESHANLSAKSEIHLQVLEDFDNQLSVCKNLTDKVATFKLLDSRLECDFDFKEYLEQKGPDFQHYWFQKLEYVLYKKCVLDKNGHPDLDPIKFKNYRITSRNSIEHIYPQNPVTLMKDPDITDDFLHSFGNLVLLSVSQNSEYGNKSVEVKRSMFKDRSVTYDSLKSFHVFQDNPKWTKNEINSHQSKMIGLLEDHYQNNLQ